MTDRSLCVFLLNMVQYNSVLIAGIILKHFRKENRLFRVP